MKKTLILILIFFAFTLAIAQLSFDVGLIHYAFIQSTNSDTSIVQTNRDFLTFNCWVGDTSSGGDSSSIEFFIDFCTDLDSADWVCKDSLTVSTDSTWTDWIVTDVPVPSFPYYRVREVGQAGNKKLSSSLSRIRKGHSYYRR